jgi:DNA-binding transcriptional regulator YiaG
METKIFAQYIDRGYGFPVIIRDVPMVKVRGKWTPNINYRQLAKEVLLKLASTAGRLSGHQVKFIRLELGMTMQQFAQRFGVTHPAVVKWEKRAAKPTGMGWSTEKDMRLLVIKMLDKSERKFFALYNELETIAPNRTVTPELMCDKVAA